MIKLKLCKTRGKNTGKKHNLALKRISPSEANLLLGCQVLFYFEDEYFVSYIFGFSDDECCVDTGKILVSCKKLREIWVLPQKSNKNVSNTRKS